MTKGHRKDRGMRLAAALCLCTGLALAVPTTGAALVGGDVGESRDIAEFMPFTPARLDPSLVTQVASKIGVDALRFTPAARPARKDRTVTVAVRVDGEAARAISIRNVLDNAVEPGRSEALEQVAATRYNLGIARGYQGFAQPATKPVALPGGIRNLAVPDLAEFRPSEGAADKPSRFKPRIALEQETATGRTPRTIEGMGEQSVDLSGSYRITRNLDVTAGVRLSQERDRLTPLTDGVEDNQAVYVGTQIRF